MMFARIEKLVRFTRWRLAPQHCLPLWWHVGRPNFGDDINPTFFGMVSGRCTRFASDRRRPHLLGAGSILERATPMSIVCGSGLEQSVADKVHAVDATAHGRGRASRARSLRGAAGIGLDRHPPPSRIKQAERGLHRALEGGQEPFVDRPLDHERLTADHGRQEQGHGEGIEDICAFAQGRMGAVGLPEDQNHDMFSQMPMAWEKVMQ